MSRDVAGKSDFGPTATWATLQARAELLARVREFFHARGFLEVETPLLSQDVVVDLHLDPIRVILPDDPRRPAEGTTMWLQTSPEFAMKRLLAAGAPSLYQVTKAFRAAEIGPRHNPEFTMVEWYRLGDDLKAAMQLTSDLAERLLSRGSAEAFAYRDLFQRFVDIDPIVCSDSVLTSAIQRHGITPPQDPSRDLLLDLLMVECIEPHLGHERPALVYHYPASQAALAQITTDEAGCQVAERFELYAQGMELANGYHELLDWQELLRRNQANNQARKGEGKPELPETGRFLQAMQSGLPSCSGVAMGFDRLVMAALGKDSLREVMAFPVERA